MGVAGNREMSRSNACENGEILYELGIFCAVQGSRRWKSQASVEHWNVARMAYKLAGHYIQEHRWKPAKETEFIRAQDSLPLV